ncbi:MAG: hypothetical protein C0507_03105 [Cyanobacteria bacterium PR.3.49]|nr:hypothetical protein [Cyanobacteria bacterium PR.3.49]
MRQKNKDVFAETTERLCARVVSFSNAHSLTALVCNTLLIFNCAAPACIAQSSNKSSQHSKPAASSPNVVAPVSPPPVAPPIGKPAGAKSDGSPDSSGSSSRYDPLNPHDQEATSRPPSPPRFDQPEAPGAASKAAGSTTQNKPGGATASTPGKAPAATGSQNSQPLLQPQVPKIAEPVVAPDLTKNANAQPGKPAENGSADEKYPAVANLEVMTFGETHPKMPIADRLANLETTVFKVTHPTDSLFVRTERLQKTLVGNEGPTPYENPQYRPPDLPSYARMPPPAQASPDPAPGWSEDARTAPPSTGNPGEGKYAYFEEIAVLPENRVVVNGQQLQDYFLEMVNTERRKVGSPPLEIDPIAEKLATEHVTQLAERAQISHCNAKGENPDRRYTLLGGTDAVTESLVSLKSGELGSKRLYRGAAAKLLRVLMSHQDDRDALTSRDSTHVGFAAEWTADRSRLIACAELVSKHAIIHPTPTEARVEEKIDVKGVMSPPYQFVRVTLAWEGGNSNLASVADESEEALPYFPPLDYIAYQRKAESGGHDRAIMILKGVGIAAAIAGGVFMPPVALAAPLIAVSGSGSGEHKPASEIPVKGGVRVEGNVFETKVPLSNENKDGLYYLTVWGSEGQGAKPVPISRRVIYVSGGKEEEPKTITNSDTGEVTAEDASKKDVKKNEKKAKKKNKSAPPSS